MNERERNKAKEMREMRDIMGGKQPGLSTEVKTRSRNPKSGFALLIGVILLIITFAVYIRLSRSSSAETDKTTASSAE